MRICKGSRVLISKAKVALSFFDRLIGLLGRNTLPSDFAMIFYNCNLIHTFFMKINIDIIMTDKKNVIINLFESVRPWKTVYCSEAVDTIEMKSGTIKHFKLKTGDKLILKS